MSPCLLGAKVDDDVSNPSGAISSGLLLDPATRRMLRVKGGDDAAFAELVAEFQDRVTGLLYHLVGNADEAEDLAQEVFLRVYRSRERYEPTAKFSTWLFTIVNNIARNSIRDRRRRKEREAVDPNQSSVRPLEYMAIAPSGAMPSRIFARGELGEMVRAAVSQLSDDQRLALILNKFEHMNYKQIAEVLGRSETAVKSLLARARSVLRDILEPYYGSSPSTGETSGSHQVNSQSP